MNMRKIAFISTILFFFAVPAMAAWKLNPYTGKMDYYESGTNAVTLHSLTLEEPEAADDGKYIMYDHGTTSWILDTPAGGGDMSAAVWDGDSDGFIDADAGGTDQDSSAWTGVATIAAGTWSAQATLTHELGGLEADVSGYTDGLYGMASGATADIDTEAELETALGSINVIVSTEIDGFSEVQALVADKTLINEEDAATIDQDWTFTTGLILGATGDITQTSAAVDWDLVDDNAAAISFDAAGQAGIFVIDTQDGAEGITTAGYFTATGNVTGAAGAFTTIAASGKITANASLDVKNGATTAGVLQIFEDSDDGTNKAIISVPTLAGDVTINLPAADGTADQYLKTDGSGNWSFDDPTGSGDITGVGDVGSGLAFTGGAGDGNTGNVLYFEGSTVNDIETILTSENAVTSDKTVTLPAETGTVVIGPVDFGTDNRLIKTNGTGNLTQITGITVDDSNNVSGVGTLAAGVTTITGVINTSVGLDAVGAVDMDYGSADVTDHTFLTDGTGTAEIVLPAGSIDSTEVLDGTLLNADINASAAIVISKTALVAGTNISLSTNTLNVDDAFLINSGDDEAGGTIGFPDDKGVVFGTGDDWSGVYDETTDDRLEFVHTAGAGADVYWDLNDNAAASTFSIVNTDGTYAANLVVDGTISQGGSLLSATYQPLHAYLTDIAAMTLTVGDIIYFDGTDLQVLDSGTNGYFLQAQGAAAPTWAEGSSTGVNETYGSGWNGDTAAPEKDDVYDYLVQFDADADGSFADETWYTNILDGTVTFTAINMSATATPGWLFQDSDASAVGTGDIKVDAATATYDSLLRLYVDDSTGEDTLYVTVDGTNEEILFAKKIDLTSAGIENVGAIADDGAITLISSGGTVTVESVVFTGGAISSATTIDASGLVTGNSFALGDGDYIGITGNEIITFNAAGSINISGASFDVDGAATATTYKADTSIEAPFFITNAAANAADAGAIRLANADNIAWEADAAGTDVVGISVDSSEVVQIAPSGASGVTITPALTLSSTLTDGTAILNTGAWTGLTHLDGHTVGDGGSSNYTTISDTGAISQAGSATLTLQDGSDFIITANANAGPYLAEDGDTVSGDLIIADTISIKSGAASGDYFSIETTDDVGGTPAQVEAMRVTVGGTAAAPLVEVGDSGATSPSVVTYLQAGADAQADTKYSGTVITGLNAGETIAAFDLVYFDGTENEWMIADADASGKFPARGIALAAGTNGNPLDVLVQGTVRNDTVFEWTANGATLYLDDVAGDAIEVAGIPATSNDCIQVVGWSITNDEAYFNFSTEWYLVE